MRGKYARLAGAILSSGGAFLLNCLINVFLTPYITSSVGTEAYGFVSLAKNFAQYALILTMALNSFAARHIAVKYHNGDMDGANTYYSSDFFGNLFLGAAVCAVMGIAIYFLDRILKIPESLAQDTKWLFSFVFLNFFITTAFTAQGTSAILEDKLALAGRFKALSYTAEAGTLILLYAFFPAKAFYAGIGLVSASVVIAASNVYIARKYTPGLAIRKGYFSWMAVKRLVMDGIWTSLNNVGELLNNGLDLVICDLMLTPVAMGQLAIVKTIHSIFSGVFVFVGQAFQPMFLKSYAEGDMDTLLPELKLSMKVSGMFANILFAGFFALGETFYRLWLPGQDTGFIYRLTMVNILTVIPGGPMQPLYYIYTLAVKKKFPCIVTILGGVLNVAGMYLLIRYTQLGAYAVVLTTAAVMCIINFITNPLYMAHVLGLPKHTFYPEIIRNVVSAAALCGTFHLLAKSYSPGGWISLAATALAYAVAGIFIHSVCVLGTGDWKRIIQFCHAGHR